MTKTANEAGFVSDLQTPFVLSALVRPSVACELLWNQLMYYLEIWKKSFIWDQGSWKKSFIWDQGRCNPPK